MIKKLKELQNIRDESDRNGMRIVYLLKRDATPNLTPYISIPIAVSFSVNNIALVKAVLRC
jgi:DNA gyrase subunit A